MAAISEVETLPEVVVGDGDAAAADALVAELHALQNTYDLDAGAMEERLRDVQERLLAAAVQAKSAAQDAAAKAQALYYRGEALNAFPAFNKEAEKVLSKAIKLVPGLTPAWNALGDVYFKKKDLVAARHCFEGALKHHTNKTSLHRLSIILRSMAGADGKDAVQLVAESVKRAKEALMLDVTDGYSWYMLGNAYMTHFFKAMDPSSSDLQNALKAYNKAETSPVNCADRNPDLYFSRGNVFQYQEDYLDAIRDYKRAAELDPSLPAAQTAEHLTRFLRKIHKMVSTKLGMKPKKLAHHLRKLVTPETFASRPVVPLADLAPGENAQKAVVCQIIAPVSRETDAPVSFVVADGAGTMVAVSLYNVSSRVFDLIKMDKEVVVLDPVLKSVTVRGIVDGDGDGDGEGKDGREDEEDKAQQEQDGDAMSYKCLQVIYPRKMIIDRRPLERFLVQPPGVKTQSFV